MSRWNELPPDSIIQATIKQLKNNGIEAEVVQTGDQAKQRAMEIVPLAAMVLDVTSVTLETISFADTLNTSPHFTSVRKQIHLLDKETQGNDIRILRSVPEWIVGSVHAVTQDGNILIASKTGSQLSGYVYGAKNVLLIVGAQKIVPDIQTGIKRIYDYCLPLENERAQQAYGIGSEVNKLLIINKETIPGRIHLVFINQVIGF